MNGSATGARTEPALSLWNSFPPGEGGLPRLSVLRTFEGREKRADEGFICRWHQQRQPFFSE
jgi:hypothetical protein